MEEFYVYLYIITETNEIFYVGKGKDDRAYKGRRNKFCEDMKNTHTWHIEILSDNLTEEEAFKLEREKIKEFKKLGYRITNQTDGGDGISGFKMPKHAKDKISKKAKEKWEDEEFVENQMWHRQNGVYQSDDFRNKMSQVTQGEKNGNYGNKWSEEMKNALSKKRKKNGKSKGVNNSRATKIMCVETQKIYEYIKLACEEYGIKNQSSITVALDNPNRTAGGMHWVRV